ncbi:gluconate 2-dehydrogenase subunit 3 family protein [Pseudomonas sp. CAN2814]|uniref:gluconate 2-dehydrogenase subunit 3 family protein n=1 Tax=Pseudomonas sp. CAN1 TaxID=3046726 RepID=UPI00264774FA|nr:gluconate 2-dehydrogenase subunit 3 family protein [Pseudomonas sp. CAN1]MDN6857780.1 gluconate 2-dehydrogenase subunit 3 family protein [Pseudomonas sp. CAN1]
MSRDLCDDEPARRRFLKHSLTLIPAVTLLGGASLVSAGEVAASAASAGAPGAADGAKAAGGSYVPLFFNDLEWLFLLAACDRLIPTDDNGPGAVAEGVPEFIDRQMETLYGHGGIWYLKGPALPAPPEMGFQSVLAPRDIYRAGIGALNAHCQQQFAGKHFHELDPARQEDLFNRLEKGDLALSEDCPGPMFFQQLLQNTREGWLSDPLHGGNRTMASWKLIGFPGARADFTDWASRPNTPYPQGPVNIAGSRS